MLRKGHPQQSSPLDAAGNIAANPSVRFICAPDDIASSQMHYQPLLFIRLRIFVEATCVAVTELASELATSIYIDIALAQSAMVPHGIEYILPIAKWLGLAEGPAHAEAIKRYMLEFREQRKPFGKVG